MGRPLYLFRAGTLRRQQHTLLFVDTLGEKRFLPIADISDIYVMAPLRLYTHTLRFLGKQGVPLHVFHHHGTYAGSFLPRPTRISGELFIAQVEHAKVLSKRLVIARELVQGAVQQIRKNLLYYHHRGQDFSKQLAFIEERLGLIEQAASISDLMGEEGKVRQAYYSAWQAILGEQEPFVRRRRPPTTLPNALVSFLNMLLYTHVLSELYHTPLHPAVSFLHEPRARRFSLALDLSEPFKPLLVDRLVFRLLNRRELSESDLEDVGSLSGVFLKEEARKKVVRAFVEQLSTTVQHRRLKRSVSYRQLLRLEAYKLMRHLLGIEPYRAFRAWW
ncbi:MAG: type I-B CRISPR-associated endonuclease Cas1b [Bacteroidia bacterium]|nr:type I-B CRISPR-associated endonuclease Cas1b [Bacteroidia bacterium]